MISELVNKNKRPLILDGPMGSRLIDLGIDLSGKLWSANCLLTNRDDILNIYRSYILAGSNVIRTNTFRTNPYFVNNSGLKITSKELVNKAFEIAKESLDSFSDQKVLIAGSNPPAEDCYSTARHISTKELTHNHFEHIENLFNCGVDFILNETFGDLEESVLVSKYCNESKIPFAISITLKEINTTYFNYSLEKIMTNISKYEPEFISINCTSTRIILSSLEFLKKYPYWGLYPNLGKESSLNKSKLFHSYCEEELISFFNRVLEFDPTILGVCCGGNENDIKLISKIITNKYE